MIAIRTAPKTYLSLWRGAIPVPPPGSKTMAVIAARVAKKHRITLDELIHGGTFRRFAWPRQEAMWLMHQERWADGRQRHSLCAIGRFFEQADHTSVRHGIQAHERRFQDLPSLPQRVAA